MGELAALRIVADEVREKGHCDRTIAEMAARAGICRSTAKNAIRAAAAMGLLTVQERRREGQKNLPNIIRIVSREWQQWMKRGGQRSAPSGSRPIGVKNLAPTGKESKRRGKSGIPPAASAPKREPESTWENRRRAIGKAGESLMERSELDSEANNADRFRNRG